MKPIHLSLSGLQSYRQKQEIDFTGLNGSGVFGIFGPTGSGKSSILDAITLALFGEVERAVKGTQGIMNHAETVLAVSFTFELTRKNGPERYRVERQFKREDDVSLSSSVSRIIHYRNGEQVVLADKHKEVNNKVQEVLGLSMADFTRAVVLPQGKFAEFLALKGAERRKMLQRLFHLEEYGEKLNKRLNARLDDAKQEKERIAAEQQGLGDASPEAVEAARASLLEAEAAAGSCRARREEAERLFEELRQLRLWQEEAARCEQEAAGLAARREEWQERERKLERASHAARLKPLLDSLQAGSRSEAECAGRQETAAAEHKRAAAGHEAARLAYERAREEWAAEDAPLSVLLEQLGQAVSRQREIRAAEERLKELGEQLAQAERRYAEDSAGLASEREKHRKAGELQAELKRVLLEAETRPEERERLRRAERAAQDLAAAERHAAELAAQADEAADALARLRAAGAADAAHRADAAAALAAAEARGLRLRAALAAAEQRLGGLAADTAAAAEACRRLGAGRERQRLAAELAQALRPGEPCPVCGALGHPAPAGGHEPAAAAADAEAAAELDRLAAACRDRGFAARQARFELGELLRRLADARPSALAADAAADAAGEAAPASECAAALTPAAAADPAAFYAQQAQTAAEELAACERELRLLATEAEPLLAQAEQDARRLAEHSARQTAAEEAAAAAARRRAEARERADALLAAWSGEYGGRSPEELAAEWTALADKDRAADALRERLRKSEPVLEAMQASLNRLQQELEALGQQKVRSETEQAAVRRQVAEMKARLKERVGDEPGSLEERMAQAQSRLEELRKREREGRESLDKEARILEDASHRATAARQAFESAAASLADIRKRWEEALSRTPFTDAEEVGSSLLDAQTEDAWSKELQAYRERVALLREKLAELELKRAGKTVAEEEWRLARERLTAAREEDEAALERRARAERDREDVEGKHVQWKALEERKGFLQVELDRMSKLQAVLRGNAFIDFVAKEQLLQVTRAASDRLSQLTRRRYAIEVDSEGGFIIRDDANGGIKRPVSTLSGGETFLTSLALALALSAQIQLTGESPLEFFFLDEGFGTLDPDLLDTVVSALEQLQMDRLTVGVISHVPELRARLPKRLIVEPAEPAGGGSRITLETM